MAFIGKAIKRAISLQTTLKKVRRRVSGVKKQEKTLLKLLKRAHNTAFGIHYKFDELLRNPAHVMNNFQKSIPIFDYDSIFEQWWHRSLEGEENVTWPVKIQYFALSSGTSGSPSKHIPVSQAMIKSIRRTSVRQILSLAYYDLPPDLFEKGIMMLGGSTELEKRSSYYEGDLSGINAAQIPFWFQAHYKPGKKIAKERDWEAKLDEITKNAKNWDIGILVGVPAWIQITVERIIKYYNVKDIHEIWPNLSIYVHGGVYFEPYKKGFEKLLGKPIHYIETYLASEGFIAYQSEKEVKGMELVLNNGIYFEFIPFNEQNFDQDGKIKANAEVLTLEKVELDKDYALLISTCAGTWRYLIGDTIRFKDLNKYEIIITGRVKHYISICGEHLSVDNMNHAILKTSAQFNVSVPEFAVAGKIEDNVFSHHWFIGCDTTLDADTFCDELDEHLKILNDDYKVERRSALKKMDLTVLPIHLFYDWMRSVGKEGGQNKFPRVIKNEQLKSWEQFISLNRP